MCNEYKKMCKKYFKKLKTPSVVKFKNYDVLTYRSTTF